MSVLLSHPNEANEFLQRVYSRYSRRNTDAEDPWYDAITDPFPGGGDILPPRDPEAMRWLAYCLAAKLVDWAVLPVAGAEEVQGSALRLTVQGDAELLMWERSQQVLPQDGVKLKECDVPPQFRQDEDPDKDLLTTNYIVGDESDWGLTKTDLSRYHGPGKPLTRRVWVGGEYVYLHRELKALRKAKTDRM